MGTQKISIPSSEYEFTFSRSSGAGGQNVNKVNSKVTLHWNLAQSSLPTEVLEKVRSFARNRINKRDILQISVSIFREQLKNRQHAIEMLQELVDTAVIPVKRRIKTKPKKSANENRLDNKKRRSKLKALRRAKYD